MDISQSVRIYAQNEIPLRKNEILRYSGCRGDLNEQLEALLNECIEKCRPALKPTVCYKEVNITRENHSLESDFYLDGINVNSYNLSRMLNGYEKALIMAATVGIGIDRLIKQYSVSSADRLVFVQAIGAEAVESLCDEFCRYLREQYKRVSPRFSPGYGDLSLDFQKSIEQILSMKKHIGIALNDNCLMVPSKSVTAIIGVE